MAIIGAGNMAYNLCHNFIEHGISVRMVFNRSAAPLDKFRKQLKVRVSSDWNDLDVSADLYLIAVSDDAIKDVAKRLHGLILKDAIIAHTSGNTSSNVLELGHLKYGTFYPLQSVRKERPILFKEVPIFITGPSRKTNQTLHAFAANISSTVEIVSDETKSKLHVPAVFVNNFVNHVLVAAADYCEREGLDFHHLLPLLDETIERIKRGGDPRKLQTGPAIRNDKGTIKKHRQQLSTDTDLKKLYNYLTKSIQVYHEKH